MSLILFGLNHRTAPVELREQFTLTGCGLPMALEELKAFTSGGSSSEAPRLREGVVLSTCNRFEVYAVAGNEKDKFTPIEEFLNRLQGTPVEELRHHFYRMEGGEAIKHLMRVAAGVDSMVVGEPQILGQVNEAFREAQAARTLGTILTQVFNRAIRVGKRARTETDIGRYTTSVSHAAVQLAENKMGSLVDRHVALIGAGDMAELAGRALRDRDVRKIAVVNRTHSRSVALAEQIRARPMGWHQLNDVLVWADIVITATDAPHTLIFASELEPILPERKGRALLFVDIAIPRDVEPEIAEFENVDIHDIDELKSVVSAGMEHRRAAIPQVNAIVDEEVNSYYDWLRSRDVTPVIVDLRGAITRIIGTEVDDAIRHLEDPNDREIVERLKHRVTKKILHHPSSRLKAFAADGNGTPYADAIRQLFVLDDLDDTK
ncbi:MAG: glutamyl-tRNA reductase [Candidatus Latescibacterota bacterium]|nr:MAG: glutamyl-tRNA reductase [Candidatus Latescibacterota bacterium]